MYETTARALLQIDEDVTMGGNSVARQIRHNADYPDQPNNEDSLLSAASHGIPMDFFSFHSITTALGIDQVGVIFSFSEVSNAFCKTSLPCFQHNSQPKTGKEGVTAVLK